MPPLDGHVAPAGVGQILHRLRHGVPHAELSPAWDRRSIPIYALIATNFLIGLVLLEVTGLSFGREYWIRFLSWPAAMIVTAFPLRRLGYQRSGTLMQSLGLIYGQGLVAFLVIVPLITFSLPFADATLARADAAIGFDWLAYEQATRPYLHPFLFAYRSFTWQPAVVLMALVGTRQCERAWQFVTAASVALAVTTILFPFAPAEGPFHHYGVAASNFMAERWTNEVRPLFAQLRAGGAQQVRANLITGLIAFPSYHATAAVLCTWAVWPVRFLRWPGLLLNIVMLASVLTIGDHYLVDLLAGTTVGGLSIVWSGHLIRGTSRLGRESLGPRSHKIPEDRSHFVSMQEQETKDCSDGDRVGTRIGS